MLSRRKFLLMYSILLQSKAVVTITCHECGNMYDGSAFMGIKDFKECQFFEHDIAEDNKKYLVQCPEADKCCFALREHMTLEFWGHAAAAEVLIRGCCSKLNHTKHHLASAEPPPLVTTMNFRAEIMSQTVQNGQVKTRVMFCNTLGCNNQRVPWSKPVPYIPVVSKDPPWSLPHDDNEVELEQHPMHTRMNRRQSLAEEQSLLAFVEKMRTTGNQNLMQRPKMPLLNAKLDPIARKRPLVTRKEERRTRTSSFEYEQEDEETAPKRMRSFQDFVRASSSPARCECNCNCPSLVCPSYQISAAQRRTQPILSIFLACLSYNLLYGIHSFS